MGGEWPTVQLGDVVQNFDSRRIPISKREREKRPGPYPYYGATGIMDYVDDYLFDGLYLLIAEDGSVERPDGKPFLQLVNGQFWVNNHAHVLRGDNDEDTKFVYYSLSTVAIRPYMSGSVQSKLSQRNLNRILIHYPRDPRDRRAIARILGTLDDKIGLNRRMNETLEAMAQALFKSWFVDFDPVVVNAIRAGNPIPEKFAARAAHYRNNPDALGLPDDILRLFPARFVDSALGPIPEGWEVGTLGDLVGFLNGYAFKSNDWRDRGIPVIKIGSVKPGIVDLNSVSYVSDKVAAQASRYRLHPGDLLISMTGYVGEVGLVPPTENPPLLNQRVGKFVFEKVGTGSLGFVYCFTRRPQFKAEVKAKSHGTAQSNVSSKAILSIPVILPPNSIRELFNRSCKPFFDQILSNWAESRTLATLRDTLLPKLISGELRVPDVEKILEDAV